MRFLIIIGFFLGVPSLADAQFPAEVRPGIRVRVWVPEPTRQEEGPHRRQLLRGTVEAVDAGALRLRVPGTATSVAIPRANVRRLDVSRGVSRGASMVERAVGGAIVFALLNDPRRSGGPHYRTDWRAAGVGAAWGAGIGAVVGLTWPYERWHRVIR